MKYRLLQTVPVAVLLLLTTLCVRVWEQETPKQTATRLKGTYILIDPGHGGEDGGASVGSGTLEKTVNLSIGNDVYALLTVLGFPVRTTRYTDMSLSTEGNTVRARKVSDMHNRLTLYNAARFTVSIHQNYFTQSQYSGTQLFCADNVQSKALGESIRKAVIGCLQPDNTRASKTASGDIFLLHESQTPAVIVECGFLTNPDECRRLCSEDYQKQITAAIVAGITEFCSKE